MRRIPTLLLFPCLCLTAAQLNLTPLPGAFPYSFAALDPAGNIYLAGTTISAIPLVNPIQSTPTAGDCADEASHPFVACSTAFVAKLDPTGTKILYSTYLGATQRYIASGLAVDSAGNAYICGSAYTPNVLQPFGAPQAFLYKVNPAGSALVYSLNLAATTAANGVAVDSAGDAYLTGLSQGAAFATTHFTQNLPAVNNFWVTNDAGATWRAITGIQSQSINSLAIDPTHNTTLYAAASSGIYKSLDAGATWTQLLPAATTAQQILLDPKNPSTLYALYGPNTSPTQFAKSTDGGATWQNLTANLPPPWVPSSPLLIGTIALDPQNTQTIWMSIDTNGVASIFMSSDGGIHWRDIHDFQAFFVSGPANPGGSGSNVFVDPTNSSRIYSCCTDVLGWQSFGLWRSEDGGKTWIAGSQGFFKPPVLDPANPTTLYAPGNGIGVSTDEGQTWTSKPPSPLAPATATTGNLTVDPSGSLSQIFDYGALLKSKDGGNTWSAVTGPWISGSHILALDPVNPTSTIYVGSNTPPANHAFLTKIDPTGAYLWANVFGGSQTDSAQAVAVDGAGNPYVAGITTSLDFPTVNAFQKSNPSKPAGSHNSGFVTRFSADGRMVNSSYLGGSFDQTVTAIATDSSGNTYVAGYTQSADFPTLNPVQPTEGYGLSTGFVTKIAPSGALVYSTFAGGSDQWAVSAVSAMAVTPQGGVWIEGSTSSIALPLVSALQPSNTGGRFLAEIDPTGASWDFSTYLDQNILAMAPLAGGNLWLAPTGFTGSLNFGPPPATPAGVPLILSVYNAASFHLSDTVSPGEAVAIFGEELAPAPQQAGSYPLPPKLGGVSVTVGGITAPLYYVSPGQINFQVPYGFQAPYGAPPVNATLVVTNGGQSGQRSLNVVAGAPGIFTATGDGSTNQAYIVHTSDYSRVTQSNPAKAGEYLAIFCTGLGITNPPAVEGQPAQAAPISPNNYFFVNVDSEVTPSYAGLAPGYAGLYQVNFQLSPTQESGMRVVSLENGLAGSQSVPIWVQ